MPSAVYPIGQCVRHDNRVNLVPSIEWIASELIFFFLLLFVRRWMNHYGCIVWYTWMFASHSFGAQNKKKRGEQICHVIPSDSFSDGLHAAVAVVSLSTSDEWAFVCLSVRPSVRLCLYFRYRHTPNRTTSCRHFTQNQSDTCMSSTDSSCSVCSPFDWLMVFCVNSQFII